MLPQQIQKQTQKAQIIVLDINNTTKIEHLPEKYRIYDMARGYIVDSQGSDLVLISEISKQFQCKIVINKGTIQYEESSVYQYPFMQDYFIYEGQYDKGFRNGFGKVYVNQPNNTYTQYGRWSYGHKIGLFKRQQKGKQILVDYRFEKYPQYGYEIKQQKQKLPSEHQQQLQKNWKQIPQPIYKLPKLKNIKWNARPSQQFLIEELNKMLHPQNRMINVLAQIYFEILFRNQRQGPYSYILDDKITNRIIQDKNTSPKDFPILNLFSQQHNFFNGRWQHLVLTYGMGLNHFCVYSINLKTNKIKYYDSLCYTTSPQRYKDIISNIRQFLRQYAKINRKSIDNYKVKFAKFELDFKVQEVPQQNDSCSCVVFSCYFVDCIVNKKTLDIDFNHKQYRKKIKHDIQKFCR